MDNSQGVEIVDEIRSAGTDVSDAVNGAADSLGASIVGAGINFTGAAGEIAKGLFAIAKALDELRLQKAENEKQSAGREVFALHPQ